MKKRGKNKKKNNFETNKTSKNINRLNIIKNENIWKTKTN